MLPSSLSPSGAWLAERLDGSLPEVVSERGDPRPCPPSRGSGRGPTGLGERRNHDSPSGGMASSSALSGDRQRLVEWGQPYSVEVRPKLQERYQHPGASITVRGQE